MDDAESFISDEEALQLLNAVQDIAQRHPHARGFGGFCLRNMACRKYPYELTHPSPYTYRRCSKQLHKSTTTVQPPSLLVSSDARIKRDAVAP